MTTGVVITMAGAGSRFARAGCAVPKYEITVHGKSLFQWSMESLRTFIDSGSQFIFVAQAQAKADEFIGRECEKLGIARHSIVELPAITDGQATTAALARFAWDDPVRPVAIYNIDTFVRPRSLPAADVRGNGWIPCFPGQGDKWSFAVADSDGRVSEVREKQRISPHATVGLYWFDSFARYISAYEQYYADPSNLEGKERYIAPLYNKLIREGARVWIHHIPSEDVFPLGTPEDVSMFASQPEPAIHNFTTAL